MKSRTETGLGVESTEIWFQDEARIGQKTRLLRRWAKRGTRSSAPSRSAHRLNLYFRCRLPEGGQRRAV